MELTIMQAGKRNLKSSRLQRIFRKIGYHFEVYCESHEQLGMNESQISVMNYSQMYSCDIGLQGSRGKGLSKYRRIFRYVGWNRRVTGMHICTTSVCSYPSGFIDGRDCKSSEQQGLGESSESVFGIFW